MYNGRVAIHHTQSQVSQNLPNKTLVLNLLRVFIKKVDRVDRAQNAARSLRKCAAAAPSAKLHTDEVREYVLAGRLTPYPGPNYRRFVERVAIELRVERVPCVTIRLPSIHSAATLLARE